MAVREGTWQSKNDSDFILRSLRKGRRVDGRRLDDIRLLRMVFSRSEGQASAEIQLGRTRVLAVATGEVVPPFPDRPTEGFLHFNVELSPMASSSFGERNPPAAVEIARVIEIGVRDSQALDTEALCIIGGEKVWQIRCDIHVLDHCGNLIDACTLATMAALRHFRRPEVTIDGSKVVIHHTDEKEPHPLALHHVPICVTFAIFEDTGDAALSSSSSSSGSGGKKRWGDDSKASSSSVAQYVAVDPSEAEEEVMKGKITFALTAHKELCALHKNGGVAVTRGTIQSCAWLAATKVEEIHKLLDGALAGADAKATSERQRRLRGTAPANTLPGTRSTPFVVAGTPMPVNAESLKVKHLDYDDLHVTTSIQEEGLRGGKEKKSQGLEMSDARNTDLFAKMAKAARMTEARIAQAEAKLGGSGSSDSGVRLSSPPSVSLGNGGDSGGDAGSSREREPSENGAPRSGAERREGSGSTPERRLEGVDGEKEAEAAARDEFTRLAKELQDSAKKTLAGQGATAADLMDVEGDDDEEEEETVTLEGEFNVAALRKSADVTDRVVSSEKSAIMGRGQGDAWGAVDDDGNDDLLTAVKKGKGRSSGNRKDKGKAKSNKSKKGRA